MITILIFTNISILLSILIILLTTLLGEKSKKEREKITPFECGFSPFKKSRRPFSLRFFIITLIFLIFDIEIALLLPLGLIKNTDNVYYVLFLALSVVFILLVGLLHEWKQGVLKWVK